jgi:hypothetical protein
VVIVASLLARQHRQSLLRSTVRDDGQGDDDFIGVRCVGDPDFDALQENRQVTSAVTGAINDAGLFQVMIPSRLGGRGANARTLTDVLIELGRSDGSAGVAGCLDQRLHVVLRHDEQSQADIWGDNPDAKACAIFFPRMTKTVGGTVHRSRAASCSPASTRTERTSMAWPRQLKERRLGCEHSFEASDMSMRHRASPEGGEVTVPAGRVCQSLLAMC